MAVDMSDSKKAFLQIKAHWDTTIELLTPVNKVGVGPILDLEFSVNQRFSDNQTIKTSINRAHKRIQRIDRILIKVEAISEDDIELIEEDPIDTISRNINMIASYSETMESEIRKATASEVENFRIDTQNDRFYISYTSEEEYSHEVDIKGYISSMLEYTNRIIKIYRKEISLIEIEDATTEAGQGLHDISQMKVDSQNALGQIEKNHEVTENLAKSASGNVSKVIISDITKALERKSERSKTQLTTATVIYMGVLFGLLLYTGGLHYASYLPIGLPTIDEYVEYAITRILFISPYALLIILALRNYNLAVRRNEYYEAKFIVANLIDGFKDKMEKSEYKDAVNATVFSELLIESADYVDGAKKRKREKESLLEKLVDKLEDRSKGAVKVTTPQDSTTPNT